MGVGALLPVNKLQATGAMVNKGTAGCTLVPSETEGPYPLDTVSNSALLRQDVREGKTGAQLNLKMKIMGNANCLPMQNAWVKIWHCDKDGYYSGYSNSGYLGTQNNAGQTFCRGVQVTDANGEVEFITIFPGWYTGRVTHIHFRVYISSVLTATSQLTFPETTKNAIYTGSALYSAHGTDPQSISGDMVFSDGYTLQMATLTPNSTTGGYDSYLEVTINGAGTAGLAQLEPETGGQFKLLQNYPNPYQGETVIPFTLTNPSDVAIELYEFSGRVVAEIAKIDMAAGSHTMVVNADALGIPRGNYIYQIVVTNANGVFRQCKVMTALK